MLIIIVKIDCFNHGGKLNNAKSIILLENLSLACNVLATLVKFPLRLLSR